MAIFRAQAGLDLQGFCCDNFFVPNGRNFILLFQTILKLLNTNFLQIVLHISTLMCTNDLKLRLLLPHEPLRLCAKILADLDWSILYHHISSLD